MSDALQRIVAIVERTGVSLDGSEQENGTECKLSEHEQYVEDLRFNNAVREVFLNRFVYMFSAYEHFVIQPNQVSGSCLYLICLFVVSTQNY